MTPPLSGHALVIDLAKISVNGLAFDTEIDQKQLQLPEDDALTVTAPIRVQGRLTKVMEQVYFRGSVQGALSVQCSRCLDLVQDMFAEDLQVVFFPIGAHGHADDVTADHSTDDLDVYVHDGNRLDLYPVVREHVVMAFPVQTLCREDCVGLCQVCGINRNEQSCACQDESEDPRFSILKRLTLPESS